MTGQTRRHLFAAAALTGAWAVSKTARAAGWWGDDNDRVRSHPHRWRDDDDHKKLHCFLRGTMIATPNGERPIETLVAGDEVRTWRGEPQPIKWIGSYKWDRPHFEAELMPVRILPSALAPTIPRHNLWVTQHHAIVIDGDLIEVGCLLNGRTISREPRSVTPLDYWHIKLDRHAIIIAEGLPCETMRGLDERPCMPLTEYGYTRDAVKSHLRSALAPFVDMRRPVDIARDRLMM